MGELFHDALFGKSEQFRSQAWESLFGYVSDMTTRVDNAEWVGLEAFFAWLEDWRTGKTLDEVLLVFNLKEIELMEWFNVRFGMAINAFQDGSLTKPLWRQGIPRSVRASLIAWCSTWIP